MYGVLLAQRDDPIGNTLQCLGLGEGGLDSLVFQERSDLVAGLSSRVPVQCEKMGGRTWIHKRRDNRVVHYHESYRATVAQRSVRLE